MIYPSIAKACVVPICNNKKFSLVHKFPADKDRFNEWIQAIQQAEPIEKLEGLMPEAIRKRFFVCSRHFSPKEYKNIESRSLNLTAVPHLNFNDLSEIHLSKAGQLKESPDCSQESPQKNVARDDKLKALVDKPPAIRILNSGADVDANLEPVMNISGSTTRIQQKLLIEPKQEPTELTQKTVEITEPPLKRMKKTQEKTINNLNEPLAKVKQNDLQSPIGSVNEAAKTKQTKMMKIPSNTKKSSIQRTIIAPLASPAKAPVEELPVSLQTQTKLLALMEVTPEQYEKLSKSLSSAERSENAGLLINLLDNDEIDPESTLDNEITVELEDGSTLNVDLLWLRDHCRCQSCYDESNHQRKVNILDIPDEVSTKQYDLEGETLNVIWNDNHKSNYDLKFLTQNQPNKFAASTELCLWNKEIIEAPMKTNCRVSMRDYMSDTEVSKKVLENLHIYGVAFIDGVQPTQQNTEFVIRQLFPVHKTLFGEMWTFSDAKKDHSDTAYTNVYLGPHNDNTYFNDAAGLQILHCITHSGTGGENFLIDGFQVADRIKQEHPDVFKRLTTTIVTGEYIEDGRHHKYSAPIINLDPLTGEVSQIRFNLYDRAPFKTVPAGKIRQFYSDLKVLAREFENVENRILFRLQPGTVLIFDNWRILHGRLAYTGKRTMTGCYVARTEFQSALRVNGFIE